MHVYDPEGENYCRASPQGDPLHEILKMLKIISAAFILIRSLILPFLSRDFTYINAAALI